MIPLVCSFMIGIRFGALWPGCRIGAVAALALILIVILRVSRRGQNWRLSPVFLLVALGYLSIQPWVAPHLDDSHILNWVDGPAVRLRGRILTTPETRRYRTRFLMAVDGLRDRSGTHAVNGHIRVTVGGNAPALSCGDRVDLRGRLRPLHNFNNPGGFDYKRYMAFKRVYASVYAPAAAVQVTDSPGPRGLAGVLAQLREGLGAFIAGQGPVESSAVLQALIIGDRSGLSPELRSVFTRAGVGHVLAISGLHVGIVATASFVVWRWLLGLYAPLLWRGRARQWAAFLTLVPVSIYGALSGFSPSTQRAVIMVAVFLMTFWIQRDHDTLNTLAVAAFLILILHPPALFSISLQLSFGAVGSIVYGISRCPTGSSNVQGRARRIGRRLALFMWVSVLAIGGTLPLVMYYFNQVAVYGLLANCVAVPVIGFGVVPLGLLGALLFPVWTTAAAWIFTLSGQLLAAAMALLERIAAWPGAAPHTFAPTGFEIACYYALGWALLNVRRAKAARVIGLVVIVCLGADGLFWMNERFWHRELRVTFIDVGQGNAALLELPGGRCGLIDGGGFADNASFDVGARIVAPLLWRKRILSLDTLILSHPNCDHLNGLIYIARHFDVDEIWSNGQSVETYGYRSFTREIREAAIDAPAFGELKRRHVYNGVAIEVLYPPHDFLSRSRGERWRDTNNNSMVIKVTYGEHSLLFPGDIEARAERELVRLAGGCLPCTVLLAPHHGSRSSSSRVFLEAVKPEAVVVSAGWRNRYRFPHTEVLQRYRQMGCAVYRTDRHGAVRVETDGRRVKLQTFLTPRFSAL